MKRYWNILKKYKISLIISPVLVFILVLCETAQPMFMANIIDNGVMEQDLSVIARIGTYMVLISLLGLVASIVNVYVSSYAGIGFGTDLREILFNKIQQFSFSDIDRFSSASLITRLTNDISKIQQVILISMRLLLRSPLMLVMAVFFVIQINAELLWILAISIPALGLSLLFILRKGFPYFIRVQQKLDQLNGVVRENLINIRVVKSFVREDFEAERFTRSSGELRDMVVKASNIVVTMFPVLQLVMNFSILAVLWLGGQKIIQGNLLVGELISVVSYLGQVLFSLMMLSMIIMSFARASASSERIVEVLNTQPSLGNTPTGIADKYKIERGNVEFENVSFRYSGGENDVLKNISFRVQAGETIAVAGSTGSAKTSMVQLIPRLYDATSGKILVDKQDVKDYNLEELHAKIGMVLQKNELFTGTIAENLKWGKPNASMEEIEEAAKAAQAHDFIMSFPKGYDTQVERGGVNLSGGQKQRICIARALIRKPRILILDDSTSAVDSETELKIRTNLNRLLTNTTVFIITQRIHTMQSADRVLILEDGQISAIGTPEELLKTSEVYQEIYNSQQLTF